MPYADSNYERSWKMQTKGVTLHSVKPKVGPTPGPWHMGPGDWLISQGTGMGYRNFPVRGPEGYDVAMVYCDEDDDEQVANARLITAAPDLLEACELLLIYLGDWNDMEDETCAAARRAIAKARGQEVPNG